MFIINPEFRDKIPPLTSDEFKRLEDNIVADGEVREPLIVWNNTLIDGHHRWQIIQKHPEIPYKVKEMDFPDKWGAISWMCSNQLGRRNVTDEQRTYLLGKLYEARKNTKGGSIEFRGNQFVKRSSAQNEHMSKLRVSEQIAKEQGVGKEKVKRAEHFAKGLDSAEEVSHGFREKVLSGEVKATKSSIEELRKLNGEELKQAVEELKKPKEERKSKKYNYADGDTRKTYQLIREFSEDAGNIDKEVEYGIEDVVGDLDASKECFLNQINFIFRNRGSIINKSEQTKTDVISFIDRTINELNKIKEEIK